MFAPQTTSPLRCLLLAGLAASLVGCTVRRGGGSDDDDSAGGDDDDDASGFDLSGLPDGDYGEPYSGQIRVAGYDGPVTFAIVAGELPDGLGFQDSGAIAGTPLSVGPVELEVAATDMTGRADFEGPVDFTISSDGADGAFLGYDHDQLTNMTWLFDLQRDVWVRVGGGGEPGQDSWTFALGVYLPGDNGLPERGQDDGSSPGYYDDVRIGDVPFSEVEAVLSNWVATEELYIDPPNYPSQHTPDGSPPELDAASGTVSAGSDSGQADLLLSHPELGDVETRVLVLPPDWCPAGEHDGGPGSGFCA